ncbi:ABC transporter permease [Dellaglioa sp. P0083]|uniref:ABC transporter permease n=1 Tax=Dellaglioa kimchii TaxID=3344667 RepID=UPI0038D491F8
MTIIVSAIGQGLLWGVLGLGLYLSFRILDFPDMTVEGTFPMGASVTVICLIHGVNPLLATFFAFLAGTLAGLATGLLYTKGKIPILLAGILVMTSLYSINLRILTKANISLLGQNTIFSAHILTNLPASFDSVVLGLILVIISIGLLAFFLNTELGQAFIATGDNEKMARSLGIQTDRMKILGLMVSNGFIGLAGGLIAQNNGYADISMGIGTIVIGLAAIIIGEVVFGNLSLTARLVAVVIGSIFYRFVILIVLTLGFNANDLKLISAIILAFCLMLPTLRKALRLNTLFEGGHSK